MRCWLEGKHFCQAECSENSMRRPVRHLRAFPGEQDYLVRDARLAMPALCSWLGFHGLNLVGTAGDGRFEAAQVCNSECQEGMMTAGIFFGTGIVLGSRAWRARSNRPIKIEPI